jgi:hypothetical protein
MLRTLAFLAISSLAASSTIQYPLGVQSDPDAVTKKPIVTSEGIQDDISADALLDRAQHLFSLAELSLDEYNHPTRVIGSKGKQRQTDLPTMVLTAQKGILRRSIISSKPSSHSETTIMSQPRSFQPSLAMSSSTDSYSDMTSSPNQRGPCLSPRLRRIKSRFLDLWC